MTAHTFVHDHYSLDAGESPSGHAITVVVGLFLIAVGVGVALTVALLPEAVAVGLLGVFIVAAGVLGHIRTPLKISDLLDTIVGLAGAAIGLTLAMAVTLIAVGFVVTVLMLIVDWARNVL